MPQTETPPKKTEDRSQKPDAAAGADGQPHPLLSKMGQQVKYRCLTDNPVRVRRDIIEDVDIPADAKIKPSIHIGGRWLFTEVIEEVTDAAIPHVPYGSLTEDELRGDHEARRDGRTRPGLTDRRDRHARGQPLDHGASAAGPHEFAVNR